MDNEKLNITISFIVAISTFLSTVYGIKSFQNQKEYEKNEQAFREFYVPLLQLIEKHLYVSNINTSSFLTVKTAIHQLIKDKYIYVPLEVQSAYSTFEATANEKNYKEFCDCFMTYYYEISNICGLKRITIRHRNKNKWYSSRFKCVIANIKYCFNCMYFILVGLGIWMLSMSIIFALFKWIGIMQLKIYRVTRSVFERVTPYTLTFK